MAVPLDLSQVLAHLEKADHELQEALAAMPTMDRMLIAHAYLFGHLRACQVVNASMLTYIKEIQAKQVKPKAPVPPVAKE